jgi:hypothetical protein
MRRSGRPGRLPISERLQTAPVILVRWAPWRATAPASKIIVLGVLKPADKQAALSTPSWAPANVGRGSS